MANAKGLIGAMLLGAAALVSAAAPAQAQWQGGHGGFGGPGFGGGGNGRVDRAINRCIRAAEFEARRFGRFAQVTDVRRVERTAFGLRVRGRIEVDQGGGFRGRSDRGRFTCFVDRGRVSDVRLSGLGNFR